MKKVLTNCNLIDGVLDSPMAGATVVIENGRISEVLAAQKNAEAREATSIDCKGGCLMPGLWDIHAHLGYPGPIPDSLPNRTIQYGMNAADALVNAGITESTLLWRAFYFIVIGTGGVISALAFTRCTLPDNPGLN